MERKRDQNPRPPQVTSTARPFRPTATPMLERFDSMPFNEKPKQKVTFKPKLTSTTVPPTLPPPGGDIPAYLSYINEAKAQYEATKKQNNHPIISPPILKKIPIPMTSPVKRKPPKTEKPSFSMLPGLFIPSWFQESPTSPKADRIGQPKVTFKETAPKLSPVGMTPVPRLPPPKNFPSYEKSKRKRPAIEGRRPPPKMSKRPPPPKLPSNYDDFVRRREMVETKPPLQLVPRNKGEFQLGKKNYYPKRHLKIPEERKGLLQRILALPEKLPKLPYLSSSKSIPSIEAGNSTTSEISIAGLW